MISFLKILELFIANTSEIILPAAYEYLGLNTSGIFNSVSSKSGCNVVSNVTNNITEDDLLFLHILCGICDEAVPSLHHQKTDHLEGLYMQRRNQNLWFWLS